jgi:outer membrane cobalamin receptor
MRSFLVLVSVCLLSSSVLAGDLPSNNHSNDLRVKILDPQSAVVPGAQVVLLRQGSDAPVSVQTSSGSGQATFRGLADGKYVVKILAAGFGVQDENVELPKTERLDVRLALVSPVQTVTVTAAGVPVPAEDSGAQVSALNASQLDGMQSIAAADALRFLPGAVVSTAGRRGGLTSLFVRGGNSNYNKVIVDGVPVNDPGGVFDFGVTPLSGVDRVELARGAQSTLYGSEAMTSVVQVFTREGTTRIPELRFGADGGTFGTARGYASLAGARGPFDYDVFGTQTNSNGQGINDVYSSSSEGANVGAALSDRVQLRLRTRHANSFSGVPGQSFLQASPPIPPDSDQRARTNVFLASVDLSIGGFSRWHHDLHGYEYQLQRRNVDSVPDRGCDPSTFNFFDCPFQNLSNINRAGFQYQGEYWARTWARTTFGYEFEDENGFIGDPSSTPVPHGRRLNHAVYVQEILTLGRLGLVGGARYVHSETFGNNVAPPVDSRYDKVVPRVAASYVLRRGGEVLSGTRLRFAYATAIQAPALDDFFNTSFANGNSHLKAEENRSLEAGFQQGFANGKYSLSGNFFENDFRRQIQECCFDPVTGVGTFENLNRSVARGAEFEAHARLNQRLSINAAYTNLSTKILESPQSFGDPFLPGQPLLRRPKNSGSLLLNYSGSKWGGNMGGSFVGRRPDRDFQFPVSLGINHAPGYARVDAGGWYQIHSRVTAYVNVENALNRHYQEVVGYPALRANFRAGLRFRLGGE